MRRRRIAQTAIVVVWSLLLTPLAVAALAPVGLGENVGVADQVQAALTGVFRPALTEAVSVADAVSTTLRTTFRPAQTDTVSIADQVATTLRATVRSALNDTVGVVEQVTTALRATRHPAVTDAVTVGEGVTVVLRGAFRPSISDSLAITEVVATTFVSAANVQLGRLADAVTAANLPAGTRVSLFASIDAARASLAQGRATATCGQLDAFVNKVQAQSGKAIPTATARDLTAAALKAEAAVPCR